MTQHFIVTEPVRFKIGDTVAARRIPGDWTDKIVGFDKVDVVGERTPITGYMTYTEPEDKRMKMPLTFDGVQLWYGWTQR